MKILVVEDDEPMAATLSQVLAAHHYLTNTITDGHTALEFAKTYSYDLILLDVMLPGMDGISVCRQLRAEGYQVPVLMVTAKGSTNDRVLGLESGADDYLVKPFEPSELLARIRALLRRGRDIAPSRLVWGDLQLDIETQEVTYLGTPIRLTPKEYGLLKLFLHHPRRIFSRSAIIDRVWAAGEFPGEEAVRTQIMGLRQKLKVAGLTADIIETVYGLGYRLKPTPVEVQPDGQPHDVRTEEPSHKRNKPSTQTTSSTGRQSGIETSPGINSHTSPQNSSRNRTRTAPSTGGNPQSQFSYGAEPSSPSTAELEMLAGLERVWNESQDTLKRQIELLDHVSDCLFNGVSDPDLYQKARAEVHRLVGGLGSFGVAHGSELARQIEQLLEKPNLNQASAQPFADLVETLKDAIRQRNGKPHNLSFTQSTPRSVKSVVPPQIRLLVVDDDQIWIEQLQAIAQGWGIDVEGATTLADARNIIANRSPDVVLLDLNFPAQPENGLSLLSELTSQNPSLPVLVVTGRNRLTDRVAVARLGGRAFLQKPITPKQLLEAVIQVLTPTRETEAKVLILDDDPLVLAHLYGVIEPWGLHVSTLDDSQHFWEALETFAPDLLILDIEMPYFNGLDLCRVVRNDPRWSEIPILFLSAHADTNTIRQVFEAGGDDYVSKPIVEPELIARLLNRLERVRTQRQHRNMLVHRSLT